MSKKKASMSPADKGERVAKRLGTRGDIYYLYIPRNDPGSNYTFDIIDAKI